MFPAGLWKELLHCTGFVLYYFILYYLTNSSLSFSLLYYTENTPLCSWRKTNFQVKSQTCFRRCFGLVVLFSPLTSLGKLQGQSVLPSSRQKGMGGVSACVAAVTSWHSGSLFREGWRTWTTNLMYLHREEPQAASHSGRKGAEAARD